MKLIRLEIAGFKSFADPMVIDFNANITGVIGPNGCGKSNVVDAIRWVMGELSAKQLRGSAMADVIFNGTEKRGPLGMAEVTLTMSCEGADVPMQYRDYSELAVQRRLFSNGDSEYLINKTKVRLRDIQDLFLDTGVGTKGAYAIIEQGRIGSILLGQAEERRRMIDEVAGISKFKVRRQGAERRLESTMQSMERLNDMIGDLRKRANTLRRQAEQAQRYKDLKAELAQIEQVELVQHYLEAVAECHFYENQLALLVERESMASGQLSLSETRLDNLQLHRIMEEDKLRQLDSIRQHIITRIATLERDILHGDQELSLSKEREQNIVHDVDEAKEQLSQLTQTAVDMEVVVNHLKEVMAEKEDQLREKSADLFELQQEHLSMQRQADRLAVAMLEAVECISKEQNTLEMLSRQQEELTRRKDQAQLALNDLEEERYQAQEKQRQMEDAVQKAFEIIDEYNFQHDELKSTTDRLLLKQRGQKDILDELDKKLTKIRSKWESLDEIERRHDGYDQGIQALLEKREQAGIEARLFKDILKVPDQYELAVEALLGEMLQYLVLDEVTEAQKELAKLKAGHLGKAGFVLPVAPLSAGNYAEFFSNSSFVTPLNKVVKLAVINNQLESYLGQIMVFSDLEGALAAAPLLQKYHLKAVTLAGDVLDEGLFLRGGDRQSVSSGVLARQRQLAELLAQLEELEIEERQHRQELGQLEERIAQNNLRLSELAAAINRENLQRIALEKERQAAVYEAERVAERMEVIIYQLEESEKQAANFSQLQKRCQEKVAQAEADKIAVAEEQQALKDNNTSLAGDIYRLSEECSVARVSLAEYGQKLEAALTSQRGQTRSREELEGRIERLEQRLAKELAGRQASEQQLWKDQEEHKLYLAQSEAADKEVAGQQVVLQQLGEEIAELDGAVRTLRSDYQEVTKELTDVRIRREKWHSEARQLGETALTFHQQTIDELVTRYHQAPLPTRESLKQKKKVQEELRAIGTDINLLAIDEYTAAEERLKFLENQRADLEQAISDLRQAIVKIEQNSRTRFLEAFKVVNEAFKKVFVKLFNGGQAELVLLDPESPLDGGLDIIASPPGKKLQNLTLMSGGEKALTAAAMVFALFLVRPSPFCLLDEVDAPLDEANIGRFLDLIKELSRQTQFVIITHNQQTMGAADVVYGVTMEERGVSKVLSIRLNEGAS